MFDKVLIANRGEIAVRIIRTLDRMGIRSVAVFSDADAGAAHVRAATEAVRIGPAEARRSYLDIAAVLTAARRAGAQAVHPGYGFLSESAAFARACRDAGITFIGPPPEAIETMGDKIRARAAVEVRGVATVPGVSAPGLDDDALIAGAERIGYPVLVKPSAGGGGKGMHRVEAPGALPGALAQARREAASAFGDEALFVERFVDRPRHIEVQVLADGHGNVIQLGERECSLQRRHQKVIEEAPSPLLTPAQRERIGRAACETARAVGYEGAGTVEFIVSAARPDEPFFMEMNTRLQVEHPVTEAVTGIDLVEQQLRVAAGEPLAMEQGDVHLDGHAIEARVYAEDPAAGFAPAGGEVLLAAWPGGEGVRVDAGIETGDTVSSHYDPMLAKVVGHAPTRAEAIERLDAALGKTRILGVTTNVAFLRALLAEPTVRAGDLDTGLIDREAQRLAKRATPDEVLARAGLALIEQEARDDRGAWAADGWRVSGSVGASVRLRDGEGVVVVTRLPETTGEPGRVRITRSQGTAESGVPTGEAIVIVTGDGGVQRQHEPSVKCIGGEERVDAAERGLRAPAGERAPGVTCAGRGAHRAQTTPGVRARGRADSLWVSDASGTWLVERARPSQRRHGGAAPSLESPMPGTVVAVHVAEGADVTTGDAVVSVEAMKMEHVLRAPLAGTVRLGAALGDRVARGQVLATVEEAA